MRLRFFDPLDSCACMYDYEVAHMQFTPQGSVQLYNKPSPLIDYKINLVKLINVSWQTLKTGMVPVSNFFILAFHLGNSNEISIKT